MNCPLIVLMGALSHPPAPAPAGALARLDPDARDRVASAAARAPATRRAYAAQWRRFEHWCAGRETDALAAPPAEVASYLAERPERSKLATVRSAAGLADPTKTPLVSDTLRAIARQHARQPGATPRQARALTNRPPARPAARRDAAPGPRADLRPSPRADARRPRPPPPRTRARVRGDGRPPGARTVAGAPARSAAAARRCAVVVAKPFLQLLFGLLPVFRLDMHRYRS